MNEVLKTFSERYSCRDYTGAPVEQVKLDQIATAALQSPSALNKQPWHVICIKDQALMQEINDHALEVIKALPDQSVYERTMARGGNPYYKAPGMFLVLKKTGESAWADVDCGIVAQSIAISAKSVGVSTVIAAICQTVFNGERADEFKAKVNWPEGYEFGMGVIYGYEASTGTQHELDQSKVSFV